MTSAIRNDFNIITVVLGADTKQIRSKDSVNLIEYAYNNYEQINVKEMIDSKFEEWKDENEKSIYINKGVKDNINIDLGDNRYEKYSFKKEKIKDIQIEINVTTYLEAPVEQNKIIGKVQLKLDGEIIDEIDVKTSEVVEKKSISDYFCQIISMYDIILENVIKK